MKTVVFRCRSVLSRLLRLVSMFWSLVARVAAAIGTLLTPSQLVFAGYLFYVLSGWVLLCLPLSQKSTGPSSLDHLFTAMSAVSTTGLATVSTGDSYTFIGQLVILVLIQLGGIGYMTLGSFIVLSRGPVLSPNRTKAAQAVFSLPASFRLDEFIRSVVRFTAVIETLGALALYPMLVQGGVPDPLWSAVFHSISAFCTAGFSLYNDSFMSFRADFGVNATLAALSYLGAVGFIVCLDFWNKWRGRSQAVTLTSRIIIWATLWLSVLGTVLMFATEVPLQGMAPADRLLAAFFQTMAALTTVGFNTVNIGELSKASVLLLIVLMVIGASPSGTGGGIKVTTVTAILGVIRSAMRGERDVRFWGRTIPSERIWMAVAGFGFYTFILVAGVYLLDLTEATPFDQNFFEAASALGTVGLSMGITAGLSTLGKVIIILLMFVGRVGPVTFGAALFVRPHADSGAHIADSDLAV